jgi:predicted NBD/HSP70 family sugar kinase
LHLKSDRSNPPADREARPQAARILDAFGKRLEDVATIANAVCVGDSELVVVIL